MSNASRQIRTELQSDHLTPPAAYATTFADSVWQVQRMQVEALIAWQNSMAAVTQELWDEWVCHFAGGAPIDA